MAAVVEAEGGNIMKKNTHENKQFTLTVRGIMVSSAVAIVATCLLVAMASAQSVTSRGKGFASAQEAADALIAATSAYDEAQLKEILGAGS